MFQTKELSNLQLCQSGFFLSKQRFNELALTEDNAHWVTWKRLIKEKKKNDIFGPPDNEI